MSKESGGTERDRVKEKEKRELKRRMERATGMKEGREKQKCRE